MRYCNQCHRITIGEPLFCNFCGRSYDVRLCSHRHVNPRSAQICSQCGSRELSTPHPRQSFLLKLSLKFLALLPVLALIAASAMFVLGLLEAVLTNPRALSPLIVVGLMLAGLWWLYLQLPGWIRKAIAKIFGRKGGSHDGH